MEELKPVSKFGDDNAQFFDPMTGKPNDGSPVGSKAVCVCGYELLEESDGTFRCAGGNHRYLQENMDWMKDKFGNILIRIPQNGKGGKKNGRKSS